MKPPRHIQVGPFRYRVRVDQIDDCGTTDPDRLTITLRESNPSDVQRETLLHEVLHAVLANCGLAKELGDDQEEHVVRALSPILLDTFDRNPRLVDFLLEV